MDLEKDAEGRSCKFQYFFDVMQVTPSQLPFHKLQAFSHVVWNADYSKVERLRSQWQFGQQLALVNKKTTNFN